MFKNLVLNYDRKRPFELSAIILSAFVCQGVDGKILLNKVLIRYGSVVLPLLICFRVGYCDENFVKINDLASL
jgi:hypothetical protein